MQAPRGRVRRFSIEPAPSRRPHQRGGAAAGMRADSPSATPSRRGSAPPCSRTPSGPRSTRMACSPLVIVRASTGKPRASQRRGQGGGGGAGLQLDPLRSARRRAAGRPRPAASIPQSSIATSVCATWPMMRNPPAEPSTAAGSPSAPKTMVGDIEERGRLPGATRFATGRPSTSGRKEKSVSSLFEQHSRAPSSRAPKTSSMVVVIATTLPAASMIDRWLVPFSGCGGWEAQRRRRPPGRVAGARRGQRAVAVDQLRPQQSGRPGRAARAAAPAPGRYRRGSGCGRRRRSARPRPADAPHPAPHLGRRATRIERRHVLMRQQRHDLQHRDAAGSRRRKPQSVQTAIGRADRVRAGAARSRPGRRWS